MKCVLADLPAELEQIELHIFSDWHIGDTYCNLPFIRQQIARVKDNPSAFAICNGDLMNNATKTSPSDTYQITMSPQEQMNEICMLLAPVKEKVLMINTGNHEARTLRQDGIDISSCVAMNLGLEEKYCCEGGVLFVRFGSGNGGGRQGWGNKIQYTAYVTHGAGGGKREGGKINRLADLAYIVDTDIYIHSHTHTPAILREGFYRINSQKMTVCEVAKLFVNSSAMLNYGGYGQTNGYKPASQEPPVIYLRAGSRKKMWATL